MSNSYEEQAYNCENSDCNTPTRAAGGCAADPVLVIRGESKPIVNAKGNHTALIDWIAFTVSRGDDRDWRWMRDCLKFAFDISPEAWQGTSKKWAGYQHRVDLIHTEHRGESVNLGLVGWGGDSQNGTMHASLNAQACARVTDWQQVMEWGDSVGATIKRVDVAHDDFEGKILTIEQVRQWYEAGLFSTNGRPPVAELIDDLGSGKGKTFYIGNRVHGKLARFYEKGKKEGDPESPWVRAEVEWRNKNREIPWNIVVNPGQYLAGAYPCLEYLSLEQSRIKTVKHAASINYSGMVNWLRNSAGKSLNVMLQVEGDATTVLEIVRRDGAPKRLEPYVGLKGAMPVKNGGISDITQGVKIAQNESDAVGFTGTMPEMQESHENAEP